MNTLRSQAMLRTVTKGKDTKISHKRKEELDTRTHIHAILFSTSTH